MTKPDKKILGIDWNGIFERRPDLIPPGYHETIARIYQQEESDDEPTDD